MIRELERLSNRTVPRETFERLEAYVKLLRNEAQAQNLIASSTWDRIWERHILDCAQLVGLAQNDESWCDIGSGAGLPGIVVAIITGDPVTLLELRRLRVNFLDEVKSALSLVNLTVKQSGPGPVRAKFKYITARAVTRASSVFAMAAHLSLPDTVWILPKGQSAQKELEDVRSTWHGDFRLERSKTDASAFIMIASDVRARGAR